MLEFKIKLIRRIKKEIEEKIQDAKKAYALAKESRDSDTKSSAGDKYETGREMMQKEMDKSASLIQQYNQQLFLIDTITEILPQSSEIPSTRIQMGDLVETSQGNFFIAIGLGKIEIENKVLFVISFDSPLGIQIKGKMIGDTYLLNGKSHKILKIL